MLKNEFELDVELIIDAFNDGFWFKEECSFMDPNELERFKWKNAEFYDEENHLIFCPGLSTDKENVVYPKASLSITTLDNKKTYFLNMLNSAVLVRDYGTTWVITKNELIRTKGVTYGNKENESS